MAATELFSTSLFNDANLVSYYRSEDVNDAKSSNNLTNTGTVGFSAAQFNNGFDHGADNSTKRVTIASALGITSGSYSVSCWVKFESESSVDRYIVTHVNGTTNIRLRLWYNYNGGTRRLQFDREKGGVGNQSATYNVNLSTTMHHMVGVYDSTNVNLYLDGTLVGGPTAASGDGSGSGTAFFGTGHYGDGVTYASDGIIDDIAVFSKALTATEVSDIYNGITTVKAGKFASNIALLGT